MVQIKLTNQQFRKVLRNEMAGGKAFRFGRRGEYDRDAGGDRRY